ncbi:MAG: phosphate ABC transporter permease subunit PstC, partial [Candidatus Omnitrophica bacterium CG12_big_fil_rev_8_21_14_0_65_50_5]
MRKAELGLQFVFFLCALISIVTTIGIVVILFKETIMFFKDVSLWDFLTDSEWTPLFTNKHFGIQPLVAGTFVTSAIALLFAIPMGLLIAVYLSEYASDRTRRILKPILEILAGIPTVVYGYFALLFVTPWLQKFIPDLAGFNALSPGLVLGVMILPLISSLSEDAIYSV